MKKVLNLTIAAILTVCLGVKLVYDLIDLPKLVNNNCMLHVNRI